MKPPFLIRYLFLLFILFVSGNIISAQSKKDLDEILKEIQENYSRKVEEELKKDLPRFNKMKSEAEVIEKIKDEKEKKKSADNYKNAHKAHYGNAVKKAGVDINALLSKLQSKYPSYKFSSPDGYSIIVEEEVNDMNLQSTGGMTATGTGVSASNTPAVRGLAFTQSKDIDCALASGGSVTFGTRSVNASTTGVVAGGCTAKGSLKHSAELESGSNVQSIKLKLNYSLEVKGYAVGIIGTSSSTATATLYAKIDEQSSFISKSISKTALAPILWISSFDKSENFTNSVDVTASKGKKLNVTASVYSLSVSGVCCATNGYGKVNITTANLETVYQ